MHRIYSSLKGFNIADFVCAGHSILSYCFEKLLYDQEFLDNDCNFYFGSYNSIGGGGFGDGFFSGSGECEIEIEEFDFELEETDDA